MAVSWARVTDCLSHLPPPRRPVCLLRLSTWTSSVLSHLRLLLGVVMVSWQLMSSPVLFSDRLSPTKLARPASSKASSNEDANTSITFVFFVLTKPLSSQRVPWLRSCNPRESKLGYQWHTPLSRTGSLSVQYELRQKLRTRRCRPLLATVVSGETLS